jgi:cobalt-zinc-cadmium efflux system membrane fusion protein
MNTFFKICASAALAAGLVSCGGHKTEETRPDEKKILDSLAQHVPTEPVTFEDMSETIKLNGKIQPNEAAQAKVYALVSGRISNANTELGDYVTKGKQLASLQSTEVAGISNDLSVAKSNVELARKNLQSAEDLYKGGLATEKDYITAKLEYNKAQSELSKSSQVARITGGSGQSSYVLTAPISGYVIEKNITNNSEVRADNSNSLFTIADLSTVWVIANVYETDIPSIHLGDSVSVYTLSDPNRKYFGKIDKVYDVLDTENRTMKVRISMPNKDNSLKPEMFARIYVKGKSSGQKALAVPTGAIVLDDSKNYVVVKGSNNQLSVKPIQIIRRLGAKTFVTGVEEGDKVVTDSQVFLFEALSD